MTLRPKTGWFDLHLSDLWRYRDLTMLFVWRDFVAQYKQTVLGPLWHIIQPIFTTLLFTVFGGMAKIPTDGLPRALFVMAGVTCWGYFADCLNRTSSTFVNNAAVFGKVYFPRLCVPVSIIISNLIKFGIQFALFLIFLGFWYLKLKRNPVEGMTVHPNMAILLTPILLLIMAGLGLGVGIIVSALTTRYRDLQVVVSFGVGLAMYAAPVIYPLSMLSDKNRWLVLANPLTPLIETFRYAYLGSGSFDPLQLFYSAATTVVIVLVGIVLFNHVERTFMDTV